LWYSQLKIINPISGTFLNFIKSTRKLRIIAKKILRDFWEVHPDSEQQLKSWYQETFNAAWTGPAKIKIDYPSASFLTNNRVVFNIKGSHYRLIVKISYDYQMIWIRFIGTHAEYDKINAKAI
jgi:mRNA interferase HigB